MIHAVTGNPRITVVSSDGEQQVLFVHATGFCKETWQPVVDEMAAAGRRPHAFSMDQRGHGDSAASPPPYDWWDLGRDVLRVVDVLGLAPQVVVGHSSGAAALLMAEVMKPGVFPSMVMVEPIVFPGPYRRVDGHPLTESALKRKAFFPSLGEARENFAPKLPFSAWDPRALDAYIGGGFRAVTSGGVELKCRPEVEAEFYRGATAHGAWERLPEITAAVTLMAGAGSDTHREPFLGAQAARFATADVVVVEHASHFVPMERPDAVAAAVISAMGTGT